MDRREPIDPRIEGINPKVFIYGDDVNEPMLEAEWSFEEEDPYCVFSFQTLSGKDTKFRLIRSRTGNLFTIQNLSNNVVINDVSIGGSPILPEIQKLPLRAGEKVGIGRNSVIEIDGEWFILDYDLDLSNNGKTYQASFRRISQEEYERLNSTQLQPKF